MATRYRILVTLCGKLSYSYTPTADLYFGGVGKKIKGKPQEKRISRDPYRKLLIYKDFQQ